MDGFFLFANGAGAGPAGRALLGIHSGLCQCPIGRQVPIAAYIGVPLSAPDGSLFGTLCAIDPHTQPQAIVEELPTVQLMGCMLATVLAAELQTDQERRRAERAEADAMTGLYNRCG